MIIKKQSLVRDKYLDVTGIVIFDTSITSDAILVEEVESGKTFMINMEDVELLTEHRNKPQYV